MEFTKEGVVIEGNLITLAEITKNCLIAKVKDEKLLLLKMKWPRRDKAIKECITLTSEKIEIIKKIMFGKTIYFGEIDGKHSDVFNVFDESDIEIVEDVPTIVDFLTAHPSGHEYNHSFLITFRDYAGDGGYDDVSEDDIKEFETIWE